MVTDSITGASVHAAPNNAARDLGKKKRARSAKLKQSKLDVRREQWLSQGSVKNKEEQDGVVQERKDRDSHGSIGESNGSIHQHHHHHDSDLDSNSPNSLTSSVLGSNYSETIFTGSSSSSSSSSSGGCCSGNITEDEDGCLDDWEAVADALAAAEEKPKNACSEPPPEHHQIAQSDSHQERNAGYVGAQNSQPHCAWSKAKPSAWRPDDAFRPHCLPNLGKQMSLPNSNPNPNRKHYGISCAPWGYNGAPSPPASCPICCEDLDLTDTSFLPCLCGYRMCLFCHKTILEGDDPRCPNCRKPYKRETFEAKASVEGGRLTFQLARSCSMFTRS